MKNAHHQLILTLIAPALCVLFVQAQTPRRFLIKPYNVGATTDVHARSTRAIQVRVTDENDRPVPDAPVLFTLLGAGGQGGAGTLAGGLTSQVVTNAQGLATVEFQAGPLTGANAVLRAQVVGTDSAWQTTLKVVEPEAASKTNDKEKALQNALQSAAAVADKFVGQLPKGDLARRQFTTNDGGKASLEAMRGQVVVVHFFGSWCGASKAQARVLHQVTEHGLPPGLQVLGMAVKDQRSNPQLVKQFIADQKVNYPVVDQVDDKTFVQFVNSRDISVPQTLIYGPDGKLLAHFNGYSKQINDSILSLINKFVAAK